MLTKRFVKGQVKPILLHLRLCWRENSQSCYIGLKEEMGSVVSGAISEGLHGPLAFRVQHIGFFKVKLEFMWHLFFRGLLYIAWAKNNPTRPGISTLLPPYEFALKTYQISSLVSWYKLYCSPSISIISSRIKKDGLDKASCFGSRSSMRPWKPWTFVNLRTTKSKP